MFFNDFWHEFTHETLNKWMKSFLDSFKNLEEIFYHTSLASQFFIKDETHVVEEEKKEKKSK